MLGHCWVCCAQATQPREHCRDHGRNTARCRAPVTCRQPSTSQIFHMRISPAIAHHSTSAWLLASARRFIFLEFRVWVMPSAMAAPSKCLGSLCSPETLRLRSLTHQLHCATDEIPLLCAYICTHACTLYPVKGFHVIAGALQEVVIAEKGLALIAAAGDKVATFQQVRILHMVLHAASSGLFMQ